MIYNMACSISSRVPMSIWAPTRARSGCSRPRPLSRSPSQPHSPPSSSSSSSSPPAQACQSSFLQRVLPGFNLLLGPEAQPRVILSALSTITDVKVLSSPSLAVVDNQPALLEVGNQIPVTTSSATLLTNPNTPVVNTIDMRSTGVILKILPRI